MQPKKLEQYKYFQVIAWAICLLFAFFVLTLTLRLKNIVSHIADIQNSNHELERRLMNIESTINSESINNSLEKNRN